MPIFDMYGGRPNIYTENETDRINNPEKYNYDQAQYADGGIVQHMQLGGMASPYADPIQKQPDVNHMAVMPQRSNHMAMAQPAPQQGMQMGGVGGLFQNMMGMQQAQMGGAPLEVYGNYLNNVYTAPQAESSQEQVAEFIDMVDQAERAHFGAEESFGYGGGSYQKGLMSQYQQNIPPPMTGGGGPSGKEQFGGMSLTQQLPNGLTVY